MERVNFVSSSEVLELLNLPHYTADAEAGYVRAFDRPELGFPSEHLAFLEAVRGERLRGLVDEWLQTGIDHNGSEHPGKRQVEATSHALYALRSYGERFPTRPSPFDDSNPRIVIGDPSDLPPPSRNPLFDVGLDAQRLFFGIVMSEWKSQLCKCRHCGRYFLHPHPRERYIKGTFCCRQHQSHTTAVERTRSRRQRGKAQLIEFAAKHLLVLGVVSPEWKADFGTRRRLARALAEYVSDRGGAGLRVDYPLLEVRWVTRNRQQIEAKRVELATKS